MVNLLFRTRICVEINELYSNEPIDGTSKADHHFSVPWKMDSQPLSQTNVCADSSLALPPEVAELGEKSPQHDFKSMLSKYNKETLQKEIKDAIK